MRTIRLYDMLWVDIGETAITLKFAESVSKSSVKPASITYPFEGSAREKVEEWVSNLLAKAYEGSTNNCALSLAIADWSRFPSVEALQSYH